KLSFSDYYKYSIACAVAYCIPVFFFFRNEKFGSIWLLYFGSALFAFAVLISDVLVSRKLKNISRFSAMIKAGGKIIISSIIMVCLIVAFLAFAFRNHILMQKPANFNSIYLLLPLSAILINLMAAAFCVHVGAFSMYKYPKNEKGEDIT
ncbi:MAG TPA: hypothetical protein VH396_19110, partial [Chitinophagaceae bacterium]